MIPANSLSLHLVNSVMVVNMPATSAANVETSFVLGAGAYMTNSAVQLK